MTDYRTIVTLKFFKIKENPCMRINRYIASCGVASRRKADELIEQKRVYVNGTLVTEQGLNIDENCDIVEIDKKRIGLQEEKVYYMLHKPPYCISAVTDDRGRKTVIDLIPDSKRLYPVGRLDYMSTGLLLLTNDGELTNKLIHPKYHLAKTYDVTVKGKSPENIAAMFENGIVIDGYRTKPSKIELLSQTADQTLYRIVLFEGRNRQIRKMFRSLNMKVLSLKRIRIGELELGSLKEGEYRKLTFLELSYLLEAVSKS